MTDLSDPQMGELLPGRVQISPDVRLDALSSDDCEAVRRWRNDRLETLRTPAPLTEAQQLKFYREVVSDPSGPHRYYGVRRTAYADARATYWTATLLGCVGLTNVSSANGTAEISLIVDPKSVRQGVGTTAVKLALKEAFDRLRLVHVFGESYECNPALAFWERLVAESGGYSARVPARKFWNGQYWGSYLFGWLASESQVQLWLRG